jgi:hypothetical protein
VVLLKGFDFMPFSFPVGLIAAQNSGGSNDPDFDKVVLLIKGEGTPGTSAVDSSSYALDLPGVGHNGSVAISDEQAKFGTGSLKFSSGFDFQYIPNNPALYAELKEFTFETWFYPTFFTGNDTYSGALWRTDLRWKLLVMGDTGFLRYKDTNTDGSGSGLTLNGNNPLTLNAWNFIQVRRKIQPDLSLMVELRLNGELEASGISTANFFYYGGSNPALNTIGADGDSIHGYVDELRYTVGVARSTAVPTAAFPIN